MVQIERVVTLREGGATRERKVRLIFADRRRIALTWQGATPEAYDYWLAMANYSFAWFRLARSLWPAFD